MGGYWFNSKEIECELDKLRKYWIENREKLTWREEGELMSQIDKLQGDLTYARLLEKELKSKPQTYSLHVLGMKTKFSQGI